MNPLIEEIAKTSIQLMLQEPFYGHFFSSILKDVSDKTDSVTLSLSGKHMIKLLVNENYWNTELKTDNEDRTKNLRYGAIKHQILHIVFKHMMRMNEFGDKQLFNIAADITTNQYINSDQLTYDSVRFEDFPDFNLTRGQSLDYYYKKLKEQLDGINASKGGQSDTEDDENDDLNESQQKLLDLMNNKDHKQLNQHKFWEEIQKMSSTEQKILESALNESILQSVVRMKERRIGNLPAGLQLYLDLLCLLYTSPSPRD